MKENILIIGGGTAGMEAATQLHKMGLNPIIVEKSEALGGHIAQWDRLFPAFHPAKDVVEKMLDQVKGIDVRLNTEVVDIHRDNNSFHVGQYIEKIHQDAKFSEKEKQISQKVDDFIRSKTGKSISAYSGYIFMVNKILMLSTFTEFLFQRFDIVTLFLCCVIIFIELRVFTQKHMYKWLIVLIGSLLLDALVLLDISPVS